MQSRTRSSDGPLIWEEMYAQHFPAIYAYVSRRLARGDPDVADVVADTFVVAWRRLDVVPPPPEDLIWLYGVARRVLSGHHRSKRRRTRLSTKLATAVVDRSWSADPQNLAIPDVNSLPWLRLRPGEAEVVRLTFWEELTREEAAAVLGCSTNAVTIRLHRALRRLERKLRQGEK
jgi:RNA polymerase sigma factor (sigma-70 family)